MRIYVNEKGRYEMMIGGFGMGLGMLFVIGLSLLLLVGGAFVAIQLSKKPSIQSGQQHNPRQILDVRLARGEITEEEYDVLRKRLET
jgi:putative membrane protein